MMRQTLLIAVLFSFFGQSLALADSTTFEDIENADQISGLNELEDELELSDFDSVDDLIILNKNQESTIPPRVLDKPRLKTKWTPQTFRAILKKGSLLTKLEDSKDYKIKRRLFVVAREKVVGGNIAYVLNKNGDVIYQTATKNLISIQEDLKIHPQTDPRITYKQTTFFHSTDKLFKFETDLNFHLESINAEYLTLFYGGDPAGASGTRIGLKTFYRSEFPLNFGLGFNYQGADWTGASNFETVTWDAFYFGPYLKYDLYEGEKLRLNAQLGVEKSFGFQTSSDSGANFNFKSLLWAMELKAYYDTLFGVLSFGVEYKVQRATLESSNVENLIFFPTKGSIISNGIILGYHFNFAL